MAEVTDPEVKDCSRTMLSARRTILGRHWIATLATLAYYIADERERNNYLIKLKINAKVIDSEHSESGDILTLLCWHIRLSHRNNET